jgi:hypothetical protein
MVKIYAVTVGFFLEWARNTLIPAWLGLHCLSRRASTETAYIPEWSLCEHGGFFHTRHTGHSTAVPQ